ncbi:MAG: radical SAM protein, partial [Bdellovibrionales bacterium]|nr:radical SAM protein [Bdellovibrionales bacterium]
MLHAVTPQAADTAGSPLAVYVHWPFCKFKCPYCDFNSHVREKVSHDDWRAAYVREMRHYRDLTGPRQVQSVFFGGGTPSLMEPQTAALVIDTIAGLWGLPQGTEITLEANPTSVEADKLRGFKSAGINRVSMGVQALKDADLKTLGRQHSAAEALAAVKMASQIFDRYSFDLIYARPSQSVDDWRRELAEALPYTRGHMSLYQLTIEEGTQYYTLHKRGDLVIPDEETAAQMYEVTQE